jgi:hypothetical protein
MSLDFIPFADDPDVVEERMKSLVKPSKLDRVLARRDEKRDAEKLERIVNAEVDARDKKQCRCCERKADSNASTLLERLHRHHIVYRSALGEESAANKVSLCAWCHAAEHAGQLKIIGTNANERLEFEIAEAAVVAIFGTRQLPAWVHIVLPNGERQLKETA